LRRFLIDKIDPGAEAVTIQGDEARHVAKVMRMRPGDRLTLMDTAGARYQAVIDTLTSREVRVRIESPLPSPALSPVTITICQSLLKARAMDYMVQKASELGVHTIVPFFCRRTEGRYDHRRIVKKTAHWRNIARSATKQSNRRAPAEIPDPFSFSRLMETWKGRDALKIFLWEREESQDLKNLLRTAPLRAQFIAVVGPEGGFEPDEAATARDAGFIPVSLGTRILRAETAAIAVSVIVQYEWGDLS